MPSDVTVKLDSDSWLVLRDQAISLMYHKQPPVDGLIERCIRIQDGAGLAWILQYSSEWEDRTEELTEEEIAWLATLIS